MGTMMPLPLGDSSFRFHEAVAENEANAEVSVGCGAIDDDV